MMLSTIFLIGALSQPQLPNNPTRASAPVKPIAPVVIQSPKPSRYTVEAARGFNPVRLPKGYPKDLQGQFPTNYRRDDQ